MIKETFLQQVKSKNDSDILYLCIEHMIDKIHNDTDEFTDDSIKNFFSNYKTFWNH